MAQGCAGAPRASELGSWSAQCEHCLDGGGPSDADAGAPKPNARQQVEALLGRGEPLEAQVERVREIEGGGLALLAIAADELSPVGPAAVELLGDFQSPDGFRLLLSIADRPVAEADPDRMRKTKLRRAALRALAYYDTTESAFVLARARLEPLEDDDAVQTRRSLDAYFWRMGLTGELGMCSGTTPASFAIPRGPLGAPAPTFVVAADPNRRWLVLQQAREDTDQNGAVEFSRSADGSTAGDRADLYLVMGAGPGAPIDELLGSGSKGRYLLLRRDLCLVVLDFVTRRETVLAGADLRGTVPPAGRAVTFSRGGRSLLYVQPKGGRPRVVARMLESGTETSVDAGDGILWATGFDRSDEHMLLLVAPDTGNARERTWLRWPRDAAPLFRSAPLSGGNASAIPPEMADTCPATGAAPESAASSGAAAASAWARVRCAAVNEAAGVPDGLIDAGGNSVAGGVVKGPLRWGPKPASATISRSASHSPANR